MHLTTNTTAGLSGLGLMALLTALCAPAAAQTIQFPKASPCTPGSSHQCNENTVLPPATDAIRDVIIGDVDLDGDNDVFTIGGFGFRLLLHGTPENATNGYPSPPFNLFTDYTSYGGQERVHQVTAHGSDGDLADLDNDGDMDLVLCTDAPGGGGIWVLVNRMIDFGAPAPLTFEDGLGLGWTIPFFRYPPANTLGWEVKAGDLDGDGDADLAVGTNFGLVLFANQAAQGTLGFVDVTPPTSGSYPAVDMRDIDMGDIDGDGDLDVVAAVLNGTNLVFPNPSPAGFASWAAVPMPASAPNDNHVTIDLGDVDGDGDLDVVVGTYPDQITGGFVNGSELLYFNTGFGFSLPAAIGGTTNYTTDVVLADVDEDGDLDLATTNRAVQSPSAFTPGGTALYLFDSTISAFVGAGNRIEDDSTQLGNAITAGDLDFDLDPELVVGYWATSELGYFPNHHWQFDAPRTVSIGTNLVLDFYIRPGYGNGGQAIATITGVPAMYGPLGPYGYLAVHTGIGAALPGVFLPSPGGEAHQALAVPNNPNLIGGGLYTQAILQEFPGLELRLSTRTETIVQ